MKFGILGTGVVGRTLGARFMELGHQVCLGSRSPDSEKALDWAAQNTDLAKTGDYKEAAGFGEIVFNCVKGDAALAAINSVGREILNAKILVDVSNPLDFSHGMPPSLFVCNTDSLGEQIQRDLPDTRVVKAFNTVTADIMANPSRLRAEHDLFICGNDKDAKKTLSAFLSGELGWKTIIDLGGIESSRGMEMILPLWVNLYMNFQSAMFNFKIVHLGG